MHTIIEIIERADHDLLVEPTGEGAGHYSIGLQHPVVLGLMRIFQRVERAPLGFTVRIENRIPLSSGLGAETAFLVAGVIGANNLLGNVFTRDELLKVAAEITGQPDRAVTGILGGLTASAASDDDFQYHSLPLTAMRLVIALPELDGYLDDTKAIIPERVPLKDALVNLSQLPLLLDALREGNHKRIGQAMHDRLYAPHYQAHIPAYESVVQAARDAGAAAHTFAGDGPALVFFTESSHRDVARAVEEVFTNNDIEARTWILPVDTQGVVISVAQSS
jgi:homoserine kinase